MSSDTPAEPTSARSTSSTVQPTVQRTVQPTVQPTVQRTVQQGAPTAEEINDMIAEQFPGTGRACIDLGPDFALASSVVEPANLRPGGFVSGPTQFGLADAALWYLTFGAIGRIEPMAMTSELSMRYLRPAQGTVLWARATLEKAGRRNVVGTVHLWCDDDTTRITATAQGTYALPM